MTLGNYGGKILMKNVHLKKGWPVWVKKNSKKLFLKN